MPGELCDTNQKSKGINDLTLCEHGVLSDALKDGSLTLKRFHAKDYPCRLLASCDPVIYGEAPGPHSPHTFRRCLFVNGCIDRKGPSRLSLDKSSPAPSPTPSPTPLHHCPGLTSHLKESHPAPSPPHPGPASRLKETCPVPSHPHPGPSSCLLETTTASPSRHFKEASPSPSHRLKMMQTPPLAPIVRGVDTRELILGIACLTQNSTATEATGDAVDELEMAGQSPEY